MRQNISSGAPWEGVVGYSRAVRIGNAVWVSGTAPVRNGQAQHPGDPYRQAQECISIIAESLEKAGASLADVVRTRIYVTNISQWPDIARAHLEAFGTIRPATTMVQVSALIDPAMLVEIEADAFLTEN